MFSFSQVLSLFCSHTVLPKQNGRVAMVTGGTRGMGFETARHLAGLGMHVIIGRQDLLMLCASSFLSVERPTELIFVLQFLTCDLLGFK